MIGVAIVALILVGYAVYHYRLKQNKPFLADRLRENTALDSLGKFGSDVGNELKKELKEEREKERAEQPALSALSALSAESTESAPPPPLKAEGETWCFVGEDLTGRFCVKVPSANSCSQDRTFGSRSDCEMTAASHMPAGVVSDRGLIPLSGNKF